MKVTRRVAEDEEGLVNDTKESLYQLVIGGAALISIASLLTLCLVLPSMYNYVNTVSEFGRHDFAYCEVTFESYKFPINNVKYHINFIRNFFNT